jgi:hypothetical protein
MYLSPLIDFDAADGDLDKLLSGGVSGRCRGCLSGRDERPIL